MGYHLPVLRTSCPIVPDPAVRLTYTPKAEHDPAAASGPEGRKTVAHGVSRGWTWFVALQPQRGDRIPSHETGRGGEFPVARFQMPVLNRDLATGSFLWSPLLTNRWTGNP